MNYRDKQRAAREAVRKTRVLWDKGTLNLHIGTWKRTANVRGKFVREQKEQAWANL